MSKQAFGTLANLAKIIEEAADPESQLREDRREAKPKALQKSPSQAERKTKTIDPKRKAWYERRLKEQAESQQAVTPTIAQPAVMHAQAVTRTTAASASNGLLNALASAREAKPKDGPKRPEAWKRKPGDPIF